MKEQDQWARIAAGDAQAFTAFYETTAPRLVAFLQRMVGSREAAVTIGNGGTLIVHGEWFDHIPIEGKIEQTRITFNYAGIPYTLLTAAQVARQEKVWVRVEPD